MILLFSGGAGGEGGGRGGELGALLSCLSLLHFCILVKDAIRLCEQISPARIEPETNERVSRRELRETASRENHCGLGPVVQSPISANPGLTP